VRSPAVTLPSTGTLTLSYRWYLAHGANSSSADFFRISIVHNGGTTVLFTQAGAASNRNGAYALGSVDIGDDCEFFPNVVVRERVTIGRRVIIHANSAIGSDGFGYRWIRLSRSAAA